MSNNCPCGGKYKLSLKDKHIKTKTHTTFIRINKEELTKDNILKNLFNKDLYNYILEFRKCICKYTTFFSLILILLI